jgi:hypothetical protein
MLISVSKLSDLESNTGLLSTNLTLSTLQDTELELMLQVGAVPMSVTDAYQLVVVETPPLSPILQLITLSWLTLKLSRLTDSTTKLNNKEKSVWIQIVDGLFLGMPTVKMILML